MVEKNHPTYKHQFWTVFISCFAGIVLIIFLGSSSTGQRVLPAALWFVMHFTVFAGLVAYVLRSKKHIRCLECSSICEVMPDGKKDEQRVFCGRCQIVWNLGIYTGYSVD